MFKLFFRRLLPLLLLAASAQAQTNRTAPATQPADADSQREQLTRQLRQSMGVYGRLLPDWKVLQDPAKRETLREQLTPPLKETIRIATELMRLNNGNVVWATTPQTVLLLTLGDPDVTAEVNARAASADPAVARYAKAQLANAALLIATTDEERFKQVETLASLLNDAAGQDDGLDRIYARVLSAPYLSQEVRDHAAGLLPRIKTGRFTSGATAAREGADRLSKALDQPLTLSGTTAEGKPFTTADWKGKVILVDFWATWCGPCKAELPRVKKLYEQYHDQGFEVLGVSCDYTQAALDRYQATNPLPWPSLFDAGAAKERKWHPYTDQFGVTAIPVMFLIDRQGRLRSVTARTEMEKLIPELLAEPAPQ